jgi:hypothetical protein
MTTIGVVGLYFMRLPDHANDLAHFVGVGRGADLVLYCSIVISLIAALNLHIVARSNIRLIRTRASYCALGAATPLGITAAASGRTKVGCERCPYRKDEDSAHAKHRTRAIALLIGYPSPLATGQIQFKRTAARLVGLPMPEQLLALLVQPAF